MLEMSALEILTETRRRKGAGKNKQQQLNTIKILMLVTMD